MGFLFSHFFLNSFFFNRFSFVSLFFVFSRAPRVSPSVHAPKASSKSHVSERPWSREKNHGLSRLRLSAVLDDGGVGVVVFDAPAEATDRCGAQGAPAIESHVPWDASLRHRACIPGDAKSNCIAVRGDAGKCKRPTTTTIDDNGGWLAASFALSDIFFHSLFSISLSSTKQDARLPSSRRAGRVLSSPGPGALRRKEGGDRGGI